MKSSRSSSARTSDLFAAWMPSKVRAAIKDVAWNYHVAMRQPWPDHDVLMADALREVIPEIEAIMEHPGEADDDAYDWWSEHGAEAEAEVVAAIEGLHEAASAIWR